MVIPLILAADQYTKWLIRHYFELHERVVVIDGFFNLTYVQNPGAAFGLFRDLEPAIRTPFFTVVSIVAFIILFYLFYHTSADDWKERMVLALIAGGAMGNIIDRVLFGWVTDFIQVYYKSYYWPSFNVADSCISVGVFLLFLLILFSPKQVDVPEHDPRVSGIEKLSEDQHVLSE